MSKPLWIVLQQETKATVTVPIGLHKIHVKFQSGQNHQHANMQIFTGWTSLPAIWSTVM